jgi:lipid-binding SYLF domain-containing protein
MTMTVEKLALTLLACGLIGISTWEGIQSAQAATAQELQTRAQQALSELKQEKNGNQQVLKNAKGLLVFPRVYEGGFVVAGEYGEGVLLVNNQPTGYYNMISASWGYQAGAQRKSIIIAFMTDEALAKFRNSNGWDIGADATVAVIKAGAEGSINLDELLNRPVLVMVADQRGLMGGVSLEGTKITKIDK